MSNFNILLTWVNPTVDFNKTIITKNEDHPPINKDDGVQIYNDSGVNHTDTDVIIEKRYYYGAYAYDINNNFASGVQLTMIVPLNSITEFTAMSGNQEIILLWINPVYFDGVILMRKTTGFPISVNDGTQIFSGNGTIYKDKNLENGVKYYYTGFAFVVQ